MVHYQTHDTVKITPYLPYTFKKLLSDTLYGNMSLLQASKKTLYIWLGY